MTLGVAGTIALVWGALGVFGAISTAVNYAWGVEKQRSFWKHKLFSFVMLLVAGLILLIALLLVSASQVVGASWFARSARAVSRASMVLRSFTIRHATTLLFILVVGLIYYFVPNAKVRFRDVWIGALVTGLLWKGALEAFSWYMRDMTRFTRVNGSIAAVVVFLVWVYVQAVILLYGVEFTAAYARLRARPAGGRAGGAGAEPEVRSQVGSASARSQSAFDRHRWRGSATETGERRERVVSPRPMSRVIGDRSKRPRSRPGRRRR